MRLAAGLKNPLMKGEFISGLEYENCMDKGVLSVRLKKEVK